MKGLLVAATDCEPQYITRLLQVNRGMVTQCTSHGVYSTSSWNCYFCCSQRWGSGWQRKLSKWLLGKLPYILTKNLRRQKFSRLLKRWLLFQAFIRISPIVDLIGSVWNHVNACIWALCLFFNLLINSTAVVACNYAILGKSHEMKNAKPCSFQRINVQSIGSQFGEGFNSQGSTYVSSTSLILALL